MKQIFNIVKKELDKVFKDKRTLLSTVFLPGIVIFLIYAVMGVAFDSSTNQVYQEDKEIVVVNAFNDIKEIESIICEQNNINIIYETSDFDLDEYILKIKDGKIDGLVVYDIDFLDNVNNFILNKDELKANVDLYFDTTKSKSNLCYTLYKSILSTYQIKLQGGVSNYFNQTLKKDEIVDEKKEYALQLSMIVPMLIITFVFAGAMSVSGDIVAGEKERGTIATLFMAPIKKKYIIIGKIIATSIITICCAISSFIGIVASLPFASGLFSINGISYDFFDYLSLLLLVISISLVAVSLLMILSTIAKNTKEASMFSMPIYIIAISVSMFSMFVDGIPSNMFYYLIPIYNVSLGIKGVLINSLGIINLLLILFINTLFFIISTFVITKLFESERIMYAK